MSTLEQLTTGLGRAWDALTEGWRQLRERAGHALTRFNPLARSGELQTLDDQLMQQASRWGLLAAEILESDNEVIVRLEAPGMEKDQFDISVVDDYLVVRGEKTAHHEEKRGRYRLVECAYGAFERAIPLPAAVDEQRASARYRRGVLTVTLPKTTGARSRRIKVES